MSAPLCEALAHLPCKAQADWARASQGSRSLTNPTDIGDRAMLIVLLERRCSKQQGEKPMSQSTVCQECGSRRVFVQVNITTPLTELEITHRQDLQLEQPKRSIG